MKRLLALLLAAGLVVGAVYVATGRSTTTERGPPVCPDVVCATEVQAACLRLGVGRAHHGVPHRGAGSTADRLSTADGRLGADAWLVSGFWPQIVTGNRRARRPATAQRHRSTVLGTATGSGVPPTGSERPRRSRTARPSTGSASAPMAAQPWTTFGGQPDWGDVAMAIPPVDTTEGLVTVAAAVGSAVGDRRLRVERRRRRGRRSSCSASPRDATTMTDPVDSMVVKPGSVDITAGLRADAASQPKGSVTTVWAAPAADRRRGHRRLGGRPRSGRGDRRVGTHGLGPSDEGIADHHRAAET